MVEENSVNPSEWPTYGLRQLQKPITDAEEAKKYLFIWDKQGSVATFMRYKAELCSLAPQLLKM